MVTIKTYKKPINFNVLIEDAATEAPGGVLPITVNPSATAENPSDKFSFVAQTVDSAGAVKDADYVYSYDQDTGILSIDSSGGTAFADDDVVTVIGSYI